MYTSQEGGFFKKFFADFQSLINLIKFLLEKFNEQFNLSNKYKKKILEKNSCLHEIDAILTKKLLKHS